MRILIFLTLINFACTSVPPKSGNGSEYLFPHGKYIQSAAVKIFNKDHQADYDFDCVVSHASEQFSLYGYGLMGISLFRITEIQGVLSMETSIEDIKKNQQFFVGIYKLVKKIFLLQKNELSTSSTVLLSLEDSDTPVKVEFSNYENQIPYLIKVSGQSQYSVQIKTKSIK